MKNNGTLDCLIVILIFVTIAFFALLPLLDKMITIAAKLVGVDL